MSSDIILERHAIKLVRGDVEVEDELKVEGDLTCEGRGKVRGLLQAGQLSVGRGVLEATTRNDQRRVDVSADQIRLEGRLRAGHARADSLATASIETGSIILGGPAAGEEGESREEEEASPDDWFPSGSDLEVEPDVLPPGPLPRVSRTPTPAGRGGPGAQPGGDGAPANVLVTEPGTGAGERDAAAATSPPVPGPEDVFQDLDAIRALGRLILRDGEGKTTIMLEASTGRIEVKGIGNLRAKLDEIEARIAKLEKLEERVTELED